MITEKLSGHQERKLKTMTDHRGEIGSEFWIEPIDAQNKNHLDFIRFGFKGDIRLALSGRTAIDFIIQEILESKECHQVYMPAYCCDSMLQPLINRNLSVEFFDIKLTETGVRCLIDPNVEADIIYVNNYFGFDAGISLEELHIFKNKGAIILYDRTHSLFNISDPIINIADYSLCSLRKWMGIPAGAVLCKSKGSFINTLHKECGYVEYKHKGMNLKYNFLQSDTSIQKKDFFSEFHTFDHHLEQDYANYDIDVKSKVLLYQQDFDLMSSRRKRNAQIIYEGLSDIKEMHFLFAENRDITPLFIPIMIDKHDDLRTFLIQNSVYCPIHWPKSSHIPSDFKVNTIYNNELSLICDQRYSEREILREVALIRNFYSH